MKNLLEYILIRLVEYPEEIQIDETVQDNGLIVLTITANEADYGRIIGRGGAVISAIRQIIRVRAIKEGKRAMVKVDAEPLAQDQNPLTDSEAQPVMTDETVTDEVPATDFAE